MLSMRTRCLLLAIGQVTEARQWLETKQAKVLSEQRDGEHARAYGLVLMRFEAFEAAMNSFLRYLESRPMDGETLNCVAECCENVGP